MKNTHSRFLIFSSIVVISLFGYVAIAATAEIELIIKDHLFFPAVLEIPAKQKVRIRIINQDPTPEEFESFELNREKIIVGNGQAVIFIGPLEPGRYPFFGEFNPKTAQGVVVVK
ncbi:MAG: hypothetical protein COA96_10730 [SAR86 cluster bacterium]|uniref:EfeO-type cupredoxin-like domain-containing protein n=1 Tax=SAR86 cluster bacterium TaxID=2030880 RepID=A0A2A5AXC5_9GAMM|nr:MAG: hypothetical protein COA96_10730 [SAR86 cluster bacterium]